MKRVFLSITSIIIVLLLTGVAAAATLSVRADSWPPYNAQPDGSKPGYMIEVLKEIFEPQGVTIDYKLSPWPRALHDVSTGKYDAVVGTDRGESPNFIFPSETFGTLDNVMYTLKGKGWRYNGIASLEGLRLGVVSGYGYNAELDDYIEKHTGTKVFAIAGDNSLLKLIKMLQAGRIDVLVENANVMNYTLGRAEITNIVDAGKTDQDALQLEIGFSPKKETSRNYARTFDEGIVRLRTSGRLQQILESYQVRDWH